MPEINGERLLIRVEERLTNFDRRIDDLTQVTRDSSTKIILALIALVGGDSALRLVHSDSWEYINVFLYSGGLLSLVGVLMTRWRRLPWSVRGLQAALAVQGAVQVWGTVNLSPENVRNINEILRTQPNYIWSVVFSPLLYAAIAGFLLWFGLTNDHSRAS